MSGKRRATERHAALERVDAAQKALASPLLHRQLVNHLRGIDVSAAPQLVADAARTLLVERELDLNGVVVKAFFDEIAPRTGAMRLRAVLSD